MLSLARATLVSLLLCVTPGCGSLFSETALFATEANSRRIIDRTSPRSAVVGSQHSYAKHSSNEYQYILFPTAITSIGTDIEDSRNADWSEFSSVVLVNPHDAELLLTEKMLRQTLHVANSVAIQSKLPRPMYIEISSCAELQAFVNKYGVMEVCGGAIEKLQFEGELAFLLAHEVAHHKLRHIKSDSVADSVIDLLENVSEHGKKASLIILAAPVAVGGFMVAGAIKDDGIGGKDIAKIGRNALLTSASIAGGTLLLSGASYLSTEIYTSVSEAVTLSRYMDDRKAQELVADFLAVDVIALAGFDLRDSVRLLHRLQVSNAEADSETFGQQSFQYDRMLFGDHETHPHIDERIDRVVQYIHAHYDGMSGRSKLMHGRKCNGYVDHDLPMGIYTARYILNSRSAYAVHLSERSLGFLDKLAKQRTKLCVEAEEMGTLSIFIGRRDIFVGQRQSIPVDGKFVGRLMKVSLNCESKEMFNRFTSLLRKPPQMKLSENAERTIELANEYFHGGLNDDDLNFQELLKLRRSANDEGDLCEFADSNKKECVFGKIDIAMGNSKTGTSAYSVDVLESLRRELDRSSQTCLDVEFIR